MNQWSYVWRVLTAALPAAAAAGAWFLLPTPAPRTLEMDTANPYRWADFADAHPDEAEGAYRRALELAPGVPQIQVRAANFYFAKGDTGEGLRLAGRALAITGAFDAVLFAYLDQLVPEAGTVLGAIGGDARATRAYTEHLIGRNRLGEAQRAWRWCLDKGYATNTLAASYIDALLRAKQGQAAAREWGAFAGPARGDYGPGNLVFNASFEREPTGPALDWRITPAQGVTAGRDTGVAHDGKASLKVEFGGGENLSYANVGQIVPVTAGMHRFRVWVKHEGLTTDQGPQIQIADAENAGRLDVRVGPFRGSSEWTLVNQELRVPEGTGLLVIRVLREASYKFDNKISGVLWLDGARLTRE